MFLDRKTIFYGVKEVKLEVNGIDYDIKPSEFHGIIERVGYWCKANHIHKWFVDNVQGGVDDCKEYEVTGIQLEKLLMACRTVKANPEKAKEILPTYEGFFFGTTEYNEYYFEVIEETIKILEYILSISDTVLPSNVYELYTYRANW
jgi:hypothetical protein